MIGGLYPLMIITIDYDPLRSFLEEKIPQSKEFLSEIDGVPIPIYINEELTGINIVSESRNISMNIEREQTPDEIANKEIIKQRGVSNAVSIEFECLKDSVLLQILLGLSDWIFAKGIENKARVSWLNGSIIVLNGLLADLSVRQSALDDRMFISMNIEKPLPEPVNPSEEKGSIGSINSLGKAQDPKDIL